MRICLLLFLLAVAMPSRGESALTAELVGELSHCDRAFFEALADHFMEASNIGLVSARRDYAYFRVRNRRVPGRTTVLFAEPQHIGRLAIDGYYDYILNINQDWTEISWGFLGRSSIAEAGDAVRRLVWDSERLRPGDGGMVRTEVWTVASPAPAWEKLAVDMGKPIAGTVERAFSIKPMLADPQHLAIGCTLQGRVPSSLLQRLRPDITR